MSKKVFVKTFGCQMNVYDSDKIIDALFQIQGGYALVVMTQNILIGVRDPYGIRPLVIG